MAVTDDKWGLAGFGEAELFLTKEPLAQPFSHTLCRPACAHDITSCAGSGLTKMTSRVRSLHLGEGVRLNLRNPSPDKRRS